MTLDQRVARLESSLRRWKLGAFAALLVGVCCAANGVDKFPNPERLTGDVLAEKVYCKHLAVIGDDGTTAFSVALATKGKGVATVSGSDGSSTVIVSGMNGIMAVGPDGIKKLIQ